MDIDQPGPSSVSSIISSIVSSSVSIEYDFNNILDSDKYDSDFDYDVDRFVWFPTTAGMCPILFKKESRL